MLPSSRVTKFLWVFENDSQMAKIYFALLRDLNNIQMRVGFGWDHPFTFPVLPVKELLDHVQNNLQTGEDLMQNKLIWLGLGRVVNSNGASLWKKFLAARQEDFSTHVLGQQVPFYSVPEVCCNIFLNKVLPGLTQHISGNDFRVLLSTCIKRVKHFVILLGYICGVFGKVPVAAGKATSTAVDPTTTTTPSVNFTSSAGSKLPTKAKNYKFSPRSSAPSAGVPIRFPVPPTTITNICQKLFTLEYLEEEEALWLCDTWLQFKLFTFQVDDVQATGGEATLDKMVKNLDRLRRKILYPVFERFQNFFLRGGSVVIGGPEFSNIVEMRNKRSPVVAPLLATTFKRFTEELSEDIVGDGKIVKYKQVNIANKNLGVIGVVASALDISCDSSFISLELTGNKLGALGGFVVAESIARNNSLKVLKMNLNTLGPDGGKAVASLLTLNTTLTNLEIRANGLGSSGKAIAKALETNTTLRSLNVVANQLGVEGGKALASMLNVNSVLNCLHLDRNQLGEGALAIVSSLLTNKSLKILNLFQNKLGVKGGQILGESLINNNTLTSLNIEGNELGVEGGKAVAAFLAVNSTLTNLNINNNFLGIDGCKAIAKSLETNSSLKSLNIGTNKMGVEGGKAFATALTVNSALTHFSSSYNGLDVAGGKALATALASNTTLKSIDIRYNELGVEGGKAIAAYLTTNKTLTSIDISYNLFGSDVGKLIATALMDNTTLTHLNICYNELADSGKLLASYIANNSTITSLDISDNQFTSEVGTALAQSVSNNPRIMYLKVDGNYMEENDKKMIDEAVSRNNYATFFEKETIFFL
eukprot:TRINITY_DN497_c0_g3_i4.p1 TRINITY_DN497_c0_g3~~TRINITY_DN497_c0_g3_i4.p1  ORF type:complete len:850 (+),score=221.55 TRINITY_DN497_c0_g3_i4:97-2550(+)